jgi:mono/diheme cytochrome c family protein
MPPTALPAPPVATGNSTDEAASIKYGESVVNSVGCVQCHTIQGTTSNKAGPDLIQGIKRDMPTKDWLKVQVTNPQAHNPTTIMPSFASRLNGQQLNAVVDFLNSLKTRKVDLSAAASGTEEGGSASNGSPILSINIIGNAEHGGVLFHQSCIMCHGPHGDNKTPGYTGYLTGDHAPKGVPRLNPMDRNVYDADPQLFVEHIDQFIQHGVSNPEGGPNMPAFGDSHALTQAQIASIEAYILSINGVDRTTITNPGIEPKEFFYMVLWVAGVAFLLALFYWFIIKLIKF